MRKEVQLGAVEVLLDPGVSGADPEVLRPLDDASRLGQPNDLHEVGHVANQVVVDALLIEDEDAIHLEENSKFLDNIQQIDKR